MNRHPAGEGHAFSVFRKVLLHICDYAARTVQELA